MEIGVDQYTRSRDQTFEEVANSGRQSVTGQLRPYLVQFCSIMPNHQNMPKTKAFGALLVATSPLNTYIKFNLNCTKIESKTICPYLGTYQF